MQNIIDKNIPVALEHIQARQTKNVFLEEIGANIDQINLKIEPIQQGWDNIQTELFFDQGQMVTEISGLQYIGTGQVTDPDTGIQDTIALSAPLDLFQLVLTPNQELTKEGYIYPKIDVTEAVFQLNLKRFDIHLAGDLPIYKAHSFEEAIKKWMGDSIQDKERDFKLQLQLSERQIMHSFAFKSEITNSSTAHSSLGETITLEDDHMLLSYHTEFEGKDLDPIKSKLRKVDT